MGGRFESHFPGMHVDVVKPVSVWFGQEEREGLTLVDPLLAASGTVDQPFGIDLESRPVNVSNGFWDPVHVLDGTVRVIQEEDHFFVPETKLFEVLDQLSADSDGSGGVAPEIAAAGAFGFHRWSDPGQDCQGGRIADGQAGTVAHPVFLDRRSDDGPVPERGAVGTKKTIPLGFQQGQCIDWKHAPLPVAACERWKKAAFLRQLR